MTHKFQIGDMAWSTKCNTVVQIAGPLELWDQHRDGAKLITEPTYAHRVVTLQRHHLNRSLIAKPCDLRPLLPFFPVTWESVRAKCQWKPAGLRA